MMMSVSLYTGYFSGIGKEYELLFEIVSGLLSLPAVFYSAIPFWQGARRALKSSGNMRKKVSSESPGSIRRISP